MTNGCGNAKNLAGQRFSRWTVQERCRQERRGTVAYWVCRCDCGMVRSVSGANLRNGHSKSCGCLTADVMRAKADPLIKAHKAEYATHTRLFTRCNNPNSADYKDYGGRGIKVCARWSGKCGFANFIADMGARPSPQHSIDRIDVHGDYEPSNCRWATSKQQTRNYRRNLMIEIKGETKCLKEWCEQLGAPYSRTIQRLHRGWNIEKALSTPQDNRGGRQ